MSESTFSEVAAHVLKELRNCKVMRIAANWALMLDCGQIRSDYILIKAFKSQSRKKYMKTDE